MNKTNNIFTPLPSVNENSERKSKYFYEKKKHCFVLNIFL